MDPVTGVEVVFGRHAEFCPSADTFAKELSSGDVRDRELGGQLVGLRAFTRARRANESTPHSASPDWRLPCATGRYAICSAASGSVDGGSTGVYVTGTHA
jgi:hypothetical protein